MLCRDRVLEDSLSRGLIVFPSNVVSDGEEEGITHIATIKHRIEQIMKPPAGARQLGQRRKSAVPGSLAVMIVRGDFKEYLVRQAEQRIHGLLCCCVTYVGLGAVK